MTARNRLRPARAFHGLRLPAILFAVVLLISVTGCLKTSSTVKGNVTGKVYDSNGKVLHKARVEVYGANRSVLTDELGRYVINEVEPGQKKLVATYENKSVVRVVEVPRGATLEGADLTFSVIDGLPPVITLVMVQNLTENSADITWQTNESSDSNVDFALGPIGLDPYNMLASDPAMVTEHKVTLTGLLPGRTYHFRVRSLDFERNEGVSSDYQFNTPSGDAPIMPLNFVINPPSEMERISLSWSSNTEADLAGYNLYRSESATGNFGKVNANPIASTVGSTTYRDDGLKIAQKYYYYVKAVDVAGNESAPTQTLSVVTPGILTQNQTWRTTESPYIIQGDIRIRGGATLTVEPGVEVRFTRIDSMPDPNGASMTELIVQGGLMAVGTQDRKIVFTSAESFPSKGNWGGILYQATTEPENMMRFATIMFADQGVVSEGAAPSVENCEIGLCGIGMNLGLSTALNVRYNTIRDCNIGVVSSNSNIRNNLFIDNQTGVALLGNDNFEHNTVDCLIGVQVDFGNPTIKNNIIAYTGSTKAIYGINQTQPLATPTVSFNDIFNYTFAFNGTNGTGTANLEEDPLFIGGIPYNYQLQTQAAGYASDSPALASGENGVQMGRFGP